jgi:hypothetical protein
MTPLHVSFVTVTPFFPFHHVCLHITPMVPNRDAYLLQVRCSLEEESCPSYITSFREFFQIQKLQILENRRQKFGALWLNPNLQYK